MTCRREVDPLISSNTIPGENWHARVCEQDDKIRLYPIAFFQVDSFRVTGSEFDETIQSVKAYTFDDEGTLYDVYGIEGYIDLQKK